MNWDAIGAIGEIIGALAVVTTLLILLIQVRQSNNSMIEANALQKAAAVSKHAESIGIWRSQFVQSRDTMALWLAMRDGKELDQIDLARFDNIWVNFVNTQRSNFVGANVVKEEGLAAQAARSVAVELASSPTFVESWNITKPWHLLASPEFVKAVDKEFSKASRNKDQHMNPGSLNRAIHHLKSNETQEVEK
tara:strand:+ start:3167 stop:3745 length:579 start_codon:yes stop_codon:yes gene_type:complete